MLDPDVVLADEPVASLDPHISSEVLALIARQAKARNATVLCSLHQVDLAFQFADRIVALSDGRIAFDGPPSQLSPAWLRAIYGANIPAQTNTAPERCRVPE
jgi:phosphonate transport system ATP-binding protein